MPPLVLSSGLLPRRQALAWVGVLAGMLADGCSSPAPRVVWSIRFDTAPRAEAAAFVRARIRRDACGTGAVVRDYGNVGRDGAVEMPGASLAPGRYCFEAEAVDRSCVRYAAAQSVIDVPATSTVELVLALTVASRECALLLCDDGSCSLDRDAGVDGGTDAGFTLPDARIDAGPPPPTPPIAGTGCGTIDLFGFEGVVRAGRAHTCALSGSFGPDRRLYCWGADDRGQLGVGGRGEARLPVQVPGAYTAFGVGGEHTCALDGAGALSCWGRNDHGQLGVGDREDRVTPTRVPGMFSMVAAGDLHTCALRVLDGSPPAYQLFCWGSNEHGQLGVEGDDRTSPTLVPGIGPTLVTAGTSHTCAAIADLMTFQTSNFCWGEAGPWLGHRGAGARPMATTEPPTFSSGLAAGARVTCDQSFDPMTMALATRCWGRGSGGRLLDGSDTDSFEPRYAPGTGAVAPGGSFTCQVRMTADAMAGVYCAGDRATGVLGPSPPAGLSPVLVLPGGAAVGAGERHACALGPGGLACWGANERGQLGTGAVGAVEPTPTRVCF